MRRCRGRCAGGAVRRKRPMVSDGFMAGLDFGKAPKRYLVDNRSLNAGTEGINYRRALGHSGTRALRHSGTRALGQAVVGHRSCNLRLHQRLGRP